MTVCWQQQQKKELNPSQPEKINNQTFDFCSRNPSVQHCSKIDWFLKALGIIVPEHLHAECPDNSLKE